MVLATRPDFTFPYVCADDRPRGKDPAPKHATKWRLRILSRTQREWAFANRERAVSIMDEVLRAGIVGYDQLFDVDRVTIPYEEEAVQGTLCGESMPSRFAIAQKILDRIAPETRMELMLAINNGSMVSAEDLGN